ncbi:hypothetical protein BMY_0657 [Wohlfahrtiimonas chitiniclastica]|nr:hypothetical protein [Wohlfahrtiimonas chitiniclastica]KZS22827.1 hypothetical protein BMY_0657 [Wohlfahrtiimonas chitiniclastica]
MEVGKEDEWQNDLDEELKKRGIDKPASEWFHSVFYCISAASARLQDVDCAIIRKLISKNYKVSVVLTKADTLSEEDEIEFIKVIAEELGKDIAIIPICSEQKKTRAGEILPFGKEKVENQSLVDLIDSLVLRIPKHCEQIMLDELQDWQREQKIKIEDKMSFFSMASPSEIQKELSNSSKEIVRVISDKGGKAKKNALNQYAFIANHLGDQEFQSLIGKSISDNYKTGFSFYVLALNLISILIPLIFSLWNKKQQTEAMCESVDDFVSQLTEIIQKDTKELAKSLNVIKQQVTENLL